MKVAVLVSGEGSTLRRFVKRGLPISVVIADRSCPAYTFARSAHLPAHLIEREDFSPSFDREAHTQEVLRVLIEYGIDLVVMAGWKTLLSPVLFYVFGDMVLNSHPSLLPDFKGPNAVRDALEASRKPGGPIYAGCTVFRATAKVDEGHGGRMLGQVRVPILPGDTVESLWDRIKAEEADFYFDIIRTVINEA